MSRLIFYILLLTGAPLFAQTFLFEAKGTDASSTRKIDSIGYPTQHENVKSVQDAIKSLGEKIRNQGWLESELIENKKVNDSVFWAIFKFGKKTKSIHIYIGSDSKLKELAFPGEPDTVHVAFPKVESYINAAISKLEAQGYPLAKLKLTGIKPNGDVLSATLTFDLGVQRKVNDIVIQGYDKFPAGHRKQISRLYRNRSLSRETLQQLYEDFQKFRFINQTRYPEILFMTDTTKVFVYAEKAKANRFDGIVGFSNDEDEEGRSSKIRFNGYLDLLLVNALNSGEEISLYWKSDGKKQTTFNVSAEIPYIFRSPLGLKASLQIFKQDSTFQNTKTALQIGYYFQYNKRLYLGYEATESSDIQNTNSALISDFKNRFFTATFDYTDFTPGDFLFPEKTKLVLKGGVGSRDTKLQTNSQYLAELNLMYNLYLNEKNIINLRSQDFWLQSDQYVISELYRFGGINSIRGFYENSLQASLLTSLLTEYRYVFASGIYAHSIVDYGYFRDGSREEATGSSGSLLGLGFGFGLLTKNGLFNLVYATGAPDGQAIKLSNSIVHVSFKARF